MSVPPRAYRLEEAHSMRGDGARRKRRAPQAHRDEQNRMHFLLAGSSSRTRDPC